MWEASLISADLSMIVLGWWYPTASRAQTRAMAAAASAASGAAGAAPRPRGSSLAAGELYEPELRLHLGSASSGSEERSQCAVR